MDRAQLKAWLDAGLSLPQIGALTNRDPSTVGYWVQKHGLPRTGTRRYSPRGGLTKQQLDPLVEAGRTLAEIADALDRSPPTVRYWLNKFGLKTTARRGRRPSVPPALVEKAIASRKRTLVWRCRQHGEGVFVIENSGRVRCRQCRMQAVADWRRRKKAILVKEAGGRCRLCGYDRCHAALEFHHLDPSTKSFSLSLRGVTRSLEKCRAEAAKCVLLCSNCHAEVEVGFSNV